jgi:Tfp pilus assembly protein PilP
MNLKLYVAAALLVFAVGCAKARADSADAVKYSNAEVKKMMQDAHTTQQYQALAAYFRSRQQAFEQQAQSEKAEWERRSQNVTGPAAKYPRPVDSSKNRYEYFTYEAQQMSQQAAHYEGLSSTVTP